MSKTKSNFHPFQTIYGANRIMTVQEYQALWSTGKVYKKALVYIENINVHGGGKGIGQRFLKLDVEWYRRGGPIVEASDHIIDSAIKAGLAMFKGSHVHNSTAPNVPCLGIVFPTKSNLPYNIPSSMMGAHCNGIYDVWYPERQFMNVFSVATIYDKSIFSKINDVEKSLNSGEATYFSSLFFFGLLHLPSLSNAHCILRDQTTALGRAWNRII